MSMKVKIKLIRPQFTTSECVEYEFYDAEAINNGSHLTVRDSGNCQILFKCRIDNVDCLESECD